MRVLHITHGGPQYGGVEVMLRTIAAHQSATPEVRHEFGMRMQGRLAREMESLNAPVHPLADARVRRPLAVATARKRLRELIARERFDRVLIHQSAWLWTVFAPAVRQCGVPLLFWHHDASDGRHWLERWARRTPPDRIICNSEHSRASLPKLHPGVPSEIVRCPVDLSALGGDRSRRAELRARLGAAQESPVIIQVGRMAPHKGHLVQVRALGMLREVTGWVCWEVGAPQIREEEAYVRSLERAARELGIGDRVKFVGHWPDLGEILAAADIYCQPNTKPEGFGLTFIEALWNGLPVVTSAIGGALEIVDESCGLLVPPGDPEALAATLARLIADPELRARLGAAGSARARELCDPTERMKQIASVLNAV